MKKYIINILVNALVSWLTTLSGLVAGIPEIMEGITSGDANTLIKGIGLFLLGILAQDPKVPSHIEEDSFGSRSSFKDR